MTSKQRQLAAAVLIAVGLGCGPADEVAPEGRVHEELTTQRAQPLRPTNDADSLGYDGAEPSPYVSASGDFKVWWVDDGPHGVPLEDSNGSGVPDYVEVVADTADEVAATLEQAGWKLAMSDDSGAGGEPLGGDGRFDIYLIDFRAGDGHYSADWCVDNAHGVPQCAGHFRLENDFDGLGYASREEAARLVTSHEYFHAVQDAYGAGLPMWWSEGTATWFEEFFDPSQHDFEWLTSLYFDEHTRSLHDRNRGPSDAFGYGAAIFVYFLEQHIGADGLLEIFERIERGDTVIDAVEAVVSERFVPLAEAFELFATWNLFTGSRASAEHGYPSAQRFAEVSVEQRDVDGPFNWNLAAEPLAARYARLDFGEAIALSMGSLDGFDVAPALIAVTRAEFDADATTYELDDQPLRFEPAHSPVFVVVANSDLEQRGAATLRVRIDEADADDGEPDPDPDPEDEPTPDEDEDVDVVVPPSTSSQEGGCAAAGPAAPKDYLPLAWLLAFTLVWRCSFFGLGSPQGSD